MLVDESLGRVAEEQLRDDQESDILLAVEGLLQNMAPVTVGSQFDDPTSAATSWRDASMNVRSMMTYLMQDTICFLSVKVAGASRHLCTAQLPKLSSC